MEYSSRWAKLFCKKWHDGRDYFTTNLAQQARFYYKMFCTNAQFFCENLAQWAEFCNGKFGTTFNTLLREIWHDR